MKKLFPLLFFLLCLFRTVCPAQSLVQYHIEGWAANTIGGRGGRIIHVTTLNSTGAGSITEAITASGPRIVVFDVGGVINLNGSLKSIKNPYLTLAGQTAPGKGITLINGGLSISTHDVILQHIKIRTGAAGHTAGSWEPDAFSTVGAYNVIIDHCSFSWAVDENCSASGDRFKGSTPDEWRQNTSHRVTISHNIIAEGLSHATHSKGEHSKGSLIHDNTSDIAILNNLYAHNMQRNPLFKGGARGVIVNNFIYDPGTLAMHFGLVDSEWTGYEWQTGQITVIGNHMKYGPSTSSSTVLFKMGNGPCEIYLEDNVSQKKSGVVTNEYSGDILKKVASKPTWNDNIHILPVADVLQNILSDAGARPWDRDSIDLRILNEVVTGTGKIIDYETEVGGYPNDSIIRDPFVESEWNLDNLMKLTSEVAVLSPSEGDRFSQDSLFGVEAVLTDSVSDLNLSLELVINGHSKGILKEAPYKWTLSMAESGSCELVVVVHRRGTMDTSTKTIHLTINSADHSSIQSVKKGVSGFGFYPNPFSATTTLHFSLEEDTQVALQIYNGTGALAYSLPPTFLPRGPHEIDWTPEYLSPGVYYGLLTADKKSFRMAVLYR